jgi:hypothetical protein
LKAYRHQTEYTVGGARSSPDAADRSRHRFKPGSPDDAYADRRCYT